MEQITQKNIISEFRRIFWPIEGHENKKFLPLAAMMFFILFNYSALRSIKDGFVVTSIGPEAISFLKMYVVLPSAILAMVIYVKLCNIMSPQKVFYTVTLFFAAYLTLFAFVLYPNPDLIHPDPNYIQELSLQYPHAKWFIKILGKWSYATFYTISELWGSMMLSLLFWQFANQITKTAEAKRFYSMFGLLGNFGLLLTAIILPHYLSEDVHVVSDELKFTPIFIIIIMCTLLTLFLYWWVNNYVLTDPRFANTEAPKAKKSKVKLSLSDSFKMIITSKYLWLIATLIIAYGISMNLIEGVWKAKIKELYPTEEQYTMFMAKFQGYQGAAAIFFMLVGSNILRRVSWGTAAIFTPLMILLTGSLFFLFIFFDQIIANYLVGIITLSPLVLAVWIGLIQNVLSKATKYSLFDSTKEMAYIPLDDELKSKGKAAVDVIGGRFGKSGGAVIQSTLFILFSNMTFAEATPFFAGIFFIIVILWVYTIKILNKEYTTKIEEANEDPKLA